jgi:hypothetical protein
MSKFDRTNYNKEESPSCNGVVEHISCAVGLPKLVVYLFFVDLGKKSPGPRLWAPADGLPLWFFWFIISSQTIHSQVTTSVNSLNPKLEPLPAASNASKEKLFLKYLFFTITLWKKIIVSQKLMKYKKKPLIW